VLEIKIYVDRYLDRWRKYRIVFNSLDRDVAQIDIPTLLVVPTYGDQLYIVMTKARVVLSL
jgi:hypothetical protein